MTPTFTFRPVEEKDLPLLYTWFKQPHVDRWWPVPQEKEDFFNTFLKRIRAGTEPYLVACDGRPIGYLQCYAIDETEKNWLPVLPGIENAIGIDQFIGEPSYLYKGFGTLFIKEFINQLAAKNPDVIVIVDPDPTNSAAIRCYEKVGFKRVGICQAPWGPALIMVQRNLGE